MSCLNMKMEEFLSILSEYTKTKETFPPSFLYVFELEYRGTNRRSVLILPAYSEGSAKNFIKFAIDPQFMKEKERVEGWRYLGKLIDLMNRFHGMSYFEWTSWSGLVEYQHLWD